MADEQHDSPSRMDMSARLRTWRVFLSWIRWLAAGIAALLLALMMLHAHG